MASDKPQPGDVIVLSDYEEVTAWWRLRRTLAANGETMADAISYLDSELYARKMETFEEANLQEMVARCGTANTKKRGEK